jgi:uncharacterized membrane protein YfcA
LSNFLHTLFFVFPESLSEGIIIFLICISFITSLISAIIGLGGGVILLGIFAVTLDPVAIIPVHGVVQAASNAGRLITMIRSVHTPVILPFVIGSAIGASFGGLTFSQINPQFVQLFVGIFIILTVFKLFPTIQTKHLLIVGTISSFLTVLVGGGGSFAAAVVNSIKLDKLGHIATIAFMLLVQHFMKIIIFGFLGFAFGPYISLISLMVLTGFLGTLLGRSVVVRVNEKIFRKILNAFLIILALKLIFTSIITITV